MGGDPDGYGPPVDERGLIVVGSFRGGTEALFPGLGSMATESGACVVIVDHRRPGPSGLTTALDVRAAVGGSAQVQDPATVEHPARPAAPLAIAPGAMVLDLDEIGPFLVHGCGSPAARMVA